MNICSLNSKGNSKPRTFAEAPQIQDGQCY